MKTIFFFRIWSSLEYDKHTHR